MKTAIVSNKRIITPFFIEFRNKTNHRYLPFGVITTKILVPSVTTFVSPRVGTNIPFILLC